jgi:hypothetical protein
LSLCSSLEKDDLRNLGIKLTRLGEISDRLSRDLDLPGVASSAPASSTLDTEPVKDSDMRSMIVQDPPPPHWILSL